MAAAATATAKIAAAPAERKPIRARCCEIQPHSSRKVKPPRLMKCPDLWERWSPIAADWDIAAGMPPPQPPIVFSRSEPRRMACLPIRLRTIVLLSIFLGNH